MSYLGELEMLVLKPTTELLPGVLPDHGSEQQMQSQQQETSNNRAAISIENEYKLRMTRSFADDEMRARFRENLVDR